MKYKLYKSYQFWVVEFEETMPFIQKYNCFDTKEKALKFLEELGC